MKKQCKCGLSNLIAETKTQILFPQDELAAKTTRFYQCDECKQVYKLTHTSYLFQPATDEYSAYSGPLTAQEIIERAPKHEGDIEEPK